MAETTYPYTLASDFPNGQINAEKLENEIYASAITRALSRIDVNTQAGTVDIVFLDALSAGDKTTLDGDISGPAGGLIAAHDNSPTPDHQEVTLANVGVTSSKYMKVEVEPREGIGQNYYSPNMCDRTTWYEGSTLISEYALTDSGDKITWNTGGVHDGPWIDLTHGKIFFEDAVTIANPDYLLKVEVSTDGGTNWTVQTENTFNDTDGDYSADYSAGTVTFNSALGGSDQVRASFSKAPTNLTFTIKPETGKRIRMIHVESQMSTDVSFQSDVNYEVWAYNPFDLPNKIKVKNSKYKTIMDFLMESNGVYPQFPKLDEFGPRGLKKDVIIVPFSYTAARDINDSQGVEIRMTMSKVAAGTYCNCTFYCLIEDE
jgi:hypothetical protein